MATRYKIITTNKIASRSDFITGTDNEKYLTSLSVAEIRQLPEGSILNGKIVPSVASDNLTVALKGKDGNDPSATNPVYAMIGGAIRTITSALSVTKNAGTNWCNSGSAELATKEIDYFVYLGYNATDGVVIGFSRIPFARQYSDFSATSTNEKYCAISTITNATSTDYYNVVGRFASTLSAGAGYTWTVPTFTAINLIQRPIFETRRLDYTPTITYTGGTTDPTSNTINSAKYQISKNELALGIRSTIVRGTGDRTYVEYTIPFTSVDSLSGANGYAQWGNNVNLVEYVTTKAFINVLMANDGYGVLNSRYFI